MSDKSIKPFVLLLVNLVLLGLFTDSSKGGDNTWTTTGPYGVRIYGLAIAPNNSQVIYAATPDGTVNVYKSADGGITWVSSSDGIPEGVGAYGGFVFDPDDPSTVYVATEQGVYKNLNAGGTWELKSTIEMSGTGQTYLIRAWSIANSPVDGTLYVGAYGSFPGGIGGVFRSKDGGETWEHVADAEVTASVISAIAVAPSAPHIIYAGGYFGGGVFKSTDGGESWQSIGGGFGAYPDIYCLAVDPYDSQVVYMGTAHDGIYKTTNGGQSWVPIGSGLSTSNIEFIIIDPDNQQIMYVGGGSLPGTGIPGVYRSIDNNGNSWTPMMDGMGSRAVYSLAIDHNTPQNIYAGTSSGIWKYTLISGPEDYSISINDGALFTNQTAITLTLTAPPGTTEMIISSDGGFGGATWEPFATQKPWTITAYGDYVIPRLVYAKFKTNSQTSGLYQDDIVLDVTAPTGSVEITDTVGSLAVLGSSPSVTILSTLTDTLTNTIHLPLVMRNARPGFMLVGLLLSAADDVSGIGEMLISNDAGFASAQWETYSTERNWWVPDTGTTTVYVRFRDRAGNESPVYSDTGTPSLLGQAQDSQTAPNQASCAKE